MNVRTLAALAGGALALAASLAQAQVPQYGANINLEQAKKAMVAAESEARKNGWPVAIAIVDTAGQLVMFQKIDNTQTASPAIAQQKAVSAAIFRRSTKVMENAVAAGGAGLRMLNFPGASVAEGGVPIYADGKIIGGIGASGVNGDQDAMVAQAGANVLK